MDSSHSCWASKASSSESRDESERESEVSRECTEPDMAALVQLMAVIRPPLAPTTTTTPNQPDLTPSPTLDTRFSGGNTVVLLPRRVRI